MRVMWLTGVAACLAVQGCAPYPGGYYGAAPGYGPGVAVEAEPAYVQPGYLGPAYVEPGPGYYGYGAPPVYLGGRDRFERDRGRFERERFERERFRERSERERFRPQPGYQPQPAFQPRPQPQPSYQPRPQPAYQPQPRAPQPSPRQILPGTPPGQVTYPSNNETSRSSP